MLIATLFWTMVYLTVGYVAISYSHYYLIEYFHTRAQELNRPDLIAISDAMKDRSMMVEDSAAIIATLFWPIGLLLIAFAAWRLKTTK